MFTPAFHRFGALRLAAWLITIGCAGANSSAAAAESQQSSVIVLVGAPGEEDFGRSFAQWASRWEDAAKKGGARCTVIGLKGDHSANDREALQTALKAEPVDGADLWLVMIGHGTFDGRDAKFNLRSNDVSAVELTSWLQPFRRPVAVINTASASAPFLQKLSATNRVVVTATRSGSEVNFTRLGQFLSESISSPAADLDKDGQTSLLEAWLMAARRVNEFYQLEGRLATEHSLLDDTGDAFGTPPDWFRGVRASKSAKDGAMLDGLRAHQFHLVRSEAEQRLSPATRTRRNEMERSIASLRTRKASMNETEYYAALEALLLELARLYESEGAHVPR